MRAFIPPAIVAAVILAASPAAAHWQWTKWGMTPDQVVAAGGTKAALAPTEPRWRVRLVSPVTAGGVTFESGSFAFEDGRLVAVSLDAKDALSFHKLESALGGAFGQPVVSTDGAISTRVFADKAKGNRVTLKSIGDSVFLDYGPIDTGL